MYFLNIPVADLICQLVVEDKKFYNRYRSEYKTINKPPYVNLRIYVKKTIQSYPSLKLSKKNQAFIFHFPSHKFELLDLLYLTETSIAQALIKNNILLFHASSFEYNKEGYIFCGPGGVGKSTIIKLADKAVPLSDDTTIIKKEGLKYYIYISPFDKRKCKKIAERKVRLKKIFILQKASYTNILPAHADESLKQLINNSLLQYFADKNNIKSLYHFCISLSSLIPIQKLYFTKSREFLKLIT